MKNDTVCYFGTYIGDIGDCDRIGCKPWRFNIHHIVQRCYSMYISNSMDFGTSHKKEKVRLSLCFGMGFSLLRENCKVYYERIETSDDDCCLVGNAKRMWEVFNGTDSSVIELPFSLNFSPREIYKAYYEKQ